MGEREDVRGSVRWLLLLVGAVAVALMVPFVVAGSAVDRWFAAFEAQAAATAVTALVVIALLTIDVIAPVPSSLVAALAGVAFGPLLGSAVVFIGLGLGCAVGYWLGRMSVPRLGADDRSRRAIEASQTIRARDTTIAVIVARPIPLLAEATVVVAGMSGMARRRFASACLVGNTVVTILFTGIPAALA